MGRRLFNATFHPLKISEEAFVNWKIKCLVQNAIAVLPREFSHIVYYWIQRNFGRLQKSNPFDRLKIGVEAWRRLISLGFDPVGKKFLEIGTGRVPLMPISYYLMGAHSVKTLDLDPYLRVELLLEDLKVIHDNRNEVEKLFGTFLVRDRFSNLLEWCCRESFSVSNFLSFCNIEYIAPIDASNTGLNGDSIDFYTSCAVLEHVPQKMIESILLEGNRIVRKSGAFLHIIDYTDHFSHGDKSISAINFLSFSENKWRFLAGNRFTYVNRMRHDDFLSLFEKVGHKILLDEPFINERLRSFVDLDSMNLSEQFQLKSRDILSTTGAWIATQKKAG